MYFTVSLEIDVICFGNSLNVNNILYSIELEVLFLEARISVAIRQSIDPVIAGHRSLWITEALHSQPCNSVCSYHDVQSIDNNWLSDAYVLRRKRYIPTHGLNINFEIVDVDRSQININYRFTFNIRLYVTQKAPERK